MVPIPSVLAPWSSQQTVSLSPIARVYLVLVGISIDLKLYDSSRLMSRRSGDPRRQSITSGGLLLTSISIATLKFQSSVSQTMCWDETSVPTRCSGFHSQNPITFSSLICSCNINFSVQSPPTRSSCEGSYRFVIFKWISFIVLMWCKLDVQGQSRLP